MKFCGFIQVFEITGTGSFNIQIFFLFYYSDSEIFKKPEPTDIIKIKYPGNNYLPGLSEV
jgi:hypothetical protein